MLFRHVNLELWKLHPALPCWVVLRGPASPASSRVLFGVPHCHFHGGCWPLLCEGEEQQGSRRTSSNSTKSYSVLRTSYFAQDTHFHMYSCSCSLIIPRGRCKLSAHSLSSPPFGLGPLRSCPICEPAAPPSDPTKPVLAAARPGLVGVLNRQISQTLRRLQVTFQLITSPSPAKPPQSVQA